MMLAAIYARFSTDLQRDQSIEDQIRLCKEWLSRQGWSAGPVYRDRATSGATVLRAGYQALLADVRQKRFDVVVAEALDRLSRDQEDVAGLFKRLTHAGIKLFTLAEGEITELHVGLKGTMNALFLKDLAAKTRRGLRGRVEQGKSGGGNAYGYKVVRRFNADGAPVNGDRSIDPIEADIVRQIFSDYAAGVSPKQIALRLNARGIPAPRGGAWSASTLNGNRARGTGILNNEMYVGRLVWNRLTYSKDPDTGLRNSRPNDAEAVVSVEVPELRIVSDALWQAVRDRQAKLDKAAAKTHAGADSEQAPTTEPSARFWSKQRPRYLFSGLMRCGVCGGGFSKISQQHFGCSTARNKGETACTNLITIRRDTLERTVLEGLQHRLMDPDLFKTFVAEFTTEWNKTQSNAGATLSVRRDELARVKRQTDTLVDALMNGTPPAVVNDKLKSLEARRIALEAELSTLSAPQPRLHPNLAEVYRRQVAELIDALAADDAADLREHVRNLVESIDLIPEDDRLRIEIRGALAAILALSTAQNAKSPSADAEALSLQIKMVAGTRQRLYRTAVHLRRNMQQLSSVL